jgi:sialic acid synthase SpsE
MGFKEKYLREGKYPYFIAEIGINHNGYVDVAKRMIDASKDAGADAVKFQKRNIDFLLRPGTEVGEPTRYLSRDENDISDEKMAFGTGVYPDQRVEFSYDQHLELWAYADSVGIDYLVSPWEEKSMDFLAENNAKVIKLASIDTVNYQFCEYIADKGVPALISTGMTTYEQLKITHNIFKKVNCPMMFLHCTSAYPSPIEDKHLRCITKMQALFNMDIGFSGHATGVEGTLGAVALGANVVEKHVTLNRKMGGTDHAASLEFIDLRELITRSNKIVLALGGDKKMFLDSEKPLFNILSKKIITTTEIKAGDKITKDMVRTAVTKKDGGLCVDQYYNILGAEVVKDLKLNHILEKEDFKRKI